MKKLFTLMIIMLCTAVVSAQVAPAESEKPDRFMDKTKVMQLLDQLSFTTSIGTPSFAINNFGAVSGKTLGQISVAELNLSWKISDKMSLGLSGMGALGNCSEGYYNAEGKFVELEDDDDMDEIEDENEDGECEDDLTNVLATFTYKFSDRIPIFIQAAAGYSVDKNAPAYSAMVGYYQKIFSELGITAGFRFSDVLQKKPSDAVNFTTKGLKAELGVSWNF